MPCPGGSVRTYTSASLHRYNPKGPLEQHMWVSVQTPNGLGWVPRSLLPPGTLFFQFQIQCFTRGKQPDGSLCLQGGGPVIGTVPL